MSFLLGDAPAFRADVGLYQRPILGNHENARALVRRRIKETAPEAVYFGILIPALIYARRD
ncbi:MAG: hypothetical protein JSS49_13335 [Planctomycetes bacterium]|nr:hypothetical protein [Planctomycetota bacterium]